MAGSWHFGDLIVRREVLGLQPSSASTPSPSHGVWEALPVYVVDDSDDLLVTYIAPGAELGFTLGPWPTPEGLHPWHGRDAWQGNGCLMTQVPGEHVAVWHFWSGDDRDFVGWYLNIQTAHVRTPVGYDTQDLELDIMVYADGSFVLKDDEVMDDRVDEGRFSAELVAWVRQFGNSLLDRLDTSGPWWDTSWVDWEPPDHWANPTLPDGWATA